MSTTEYTAEVRGAFRKAKGFLAAYGALSAGVLGMVAVLAATGHVTTGFLWGRSSAILASAALVYWLTVLAARGSRSAYGRVRAVTVILPVAIVAVDLIPGLSPAWFTLAQSACALAIAAAALVLNGSRVRAAFAEPR